jgi:hypothetical protein
MEEKLRGFFGYKAETENAWLFLANQNEAKVNSVA